METSDERTQASPIDQNGLEREQVPANALRHNSFGQIAVFFACIAAIAPMASMFYNVPVIASTAGAAVPLVFLLSAIGILFLGISVWYFARRLSSAAGFYTWVRHGLGQGAAFQTGWLLLGAYALFEAALQAAVGGAMEITMTTSFGFHLPGGWVSYAVIGIAIVCLFAFNVTWSVRIMAPFALAEIAALLLLDGAITLKGGASGHDLLHTFTPAGTALKGVAPGGLLGIGLGMALGILAFVGFETVAVHGEEVKKPRRTLPLALFSLLLFLTLLYLWTSYAATIGLGWQHAGDTLANVAIAPEQYYILANRYVGGWFRLVVMGLVLTSNYASCFAMHNAMTHYLYAMGRDGLLPRVFGRTHPKTQSPHIASLTQSVFSVMIIAFLACVMQHTDAQGTTIYALGLADGKNFTQTSGVVSYQWVASIVTMCLILVYILTNLAVPFFAHKRGEFHLLWHLVVPVLSTFFLLLPLSSFLLPALPFLSQLATELGFAPTPFPLNMLPLFVVFWVVCGLIYARYLARRAPQRYEQLGQIIRGKE
ncbi:APC family permease [Ktedonosporobacter rubrisoli]|uniref:APC family permease n=1 Tax=Ktedonosporobacter rubrisoli TaxID=2509675 RepID=A0A4P6JIT1_KTERU|nr:APC family permease [Ktedonosporobacter rubrisoli]QBD74978.1 APC family permease [Ktedonosporobacter rubrisoli]